MRRDFSIMILPSDGSRVTAGFKVGRGGVWALLILGGIFLALLFWVGLSYSRLWSRSRRLNEVMEENRQLRLALERLNQVERNLKDISLFRRRLSLLLGYPPWPEENALSIGDSYPSAGLPLIWPLEGWVTTEYQGDGLEITTRRGSPVISTGDGVVTFAGWKEDLGRTLIIDHQNGYSTVYGYNSALLIPQGERVKRGAVIALSGGGSFPHLYYEIRRDGVSVDPRELLIK